MSTPASHRRRPGRGPRIRRGGLVLALAFVAASCSHVPVVRDYGDAAKSNFVSACTVNSRIENKARVSQDLAPPSLCECVYNSINESNDKHYLPFDRLKEYESKVEKAKEGAVPPMPDELAAATRDCGTEGPVPSTTTTTVGS